MLTTLGSENSIKSSLYFYQLDVTTQVNILLQVSFNLALMHIFKN